MPAEELARQAVEAIHKGELPLARELLEQAVRDDKTRPDLFHALGTVLLQLGEPERARIVLEEAVGLAGLLTGEKARELQVHFILTLAAALEDLEQPVAAMATYERALDLKPGYPPARQALAFLLLAAGDLDAGIAGLESFVRDIHDVGPALEGCRDYLQALQAWRKRGDAVHPRTFLEAHRESYCEFFDHHAKEMAEKGWIAEAARMRRADDGRLVPIIEEGARPYAALRVDLVDPRTGQAGMVGDEPMVVALHGYEPLSQSPCLLPWPELPFELMVSTQVPWDLLPIRILLEHGDPLKVVDPIIGDWFNRGFFGEFGTREGGRFHFISPPQPVLSSGVLYQVDMGRSRLDAIDDLIRVLGVLHERAGLRRVILGRGYVLS